MQTYWLINKNQEKTCENIIADEKKALLNYGIEEVDDSTKRP